MGYISDGSPSAGGGVPVILPAVVLISVVWASVIGVRAAWDASHWIIWWVMISTGAIVLMAGGGVLAHAVYYTRKYMRR